MRNYISPIISERIPDFIKSDYQEFTIFLNHFYTFLEEYGNPLEVLETFYKKTEVNNQEEDFIDKILMELGFDISNQNITIPKGELVLHLREFYLNRGNEKSFKFLFRLFFNIDIDIDYPRKSLFRTSQATYSGRFFIFTTAINKDTVKFQQIIQNVSEYSIQLMGISSKVQSYVESIEVFLNDETFLLKIQIDSFYKDFIIQEGIEIVDNKTGVKVFENILDVIDFDIVDPGKNYSVEDKVLVSNANVNGVCFISNLNTGQIDDIEIVLGGDGYKINDKIFTAKQEKGHSFSGIVESVDHSQNYLSINPTASLQLETGNFTLECWVFSGASLLNQTICGNYNDTNETGWKFYIGGRTDN